LTPIWDSRDALDNIIAIYESQIWERSINNKKNFKFEKFYIASSKIMLDSFSNNRKYEALIDTIQLK
jgi:hypothetical protein